MFPRRVRRAVALCSCFTWICVSGSCRHSSSTDLATGTKAQGRRSVELVYETTIGGFPEGAGSARIWLPIPESDDTQFVEGVSVETPLPYSVHKEKQYGNRLVYVEARSPLPSEIPIKIRARIHRREVTSGANVPAACRRSRLLTGDRLAPLNFQATSRAARAIQGRVSNRSKARGIYEQVLREVDYDKSGSGWGKGDLAYVCDAGKGNCSDFHTLFIAMSRAAAIPALFEIGLPLPRDQSEGTIGGYHCWAWYQTDDGAWSPVDVSEADKRPSRADYFFGTLCENRVAFARGRDLILEPVQDGGPVNFLIYPYVEVDGETSVATIEKTFRFKNL
ncbi:MAG: transglutaminase domain-containing protein [Planctomycetes bacterium]|nr:transglutaminase domain-containing protein [Planctomycetota bacterium]